MLSPFRVARHVPFPLNLWVNAGFCYRLLCPVRVVLMALVQGSCHSSGAPSILSIAGPPHSPLPLLPSGRAIMQREDLHMVEVDVPIPGLPKDLHGLRIVQISDFTSALW